MASAISLALGTATAMPLYAQLPEDPNPVIEEVVVTGIRSSLKRAMDTKRDSFGVVDAISAEDIGKFPDTNLAESLQRITGVSISRERGEGSEVTVRGFGASFNLVTLNGRQMPTHSGTGRSFDFADIASESVSGVEVFKTGRASVPTGGIGATINVKTLRPLEQFNGDDYTPEYSGLYSQTFLDNTIGVMISGVYQKRDSGQASSSNTAWFDRDGGDAAFATDQHTNAPSEGDLVALPQQVIYTVDDWSRERINGQISLQWRPIETVTATLDYTYAELELDHTFNNMSIWFSPTGQSGTWTDGPIVSPLIYTESDNQIDFPMGAGVDASKNERDSTGFNLVWDPTDSLSFALDYHDSTAKRDPNSRYGSNAVISIASFERQAATVDYRNDIPITTTVANDPLSPDDMQITGSIFENSWAKMDIEQTQFRADWHINEQATVTVGGSYTDLDNFESSSIVQRNTWGQNQASAYGSIADLVVPASLQGLYGEISGGGQVNNNFFMFDMQEVAARAELLQSLPEGDSWHLPTALAEGDCGTGFCADSNKGAGNQLSEETTAAFVEFTYTGNMFDRPFNVRAGVRYEETDVVATSDTQDYTRIEWASVNEFSAVPADDLIGSGLEDDYNETLPSVDFDIEVIDNVVLRASYSETIARSSFEDLRGNLTIGTVLRVVEGMHTADGTVGNPGLQPHKSENIDLSVEWYYGEASYFSIGYFDKSVENFVTSAELDDVVLFPDLAHPALGPLYDAAVGALGITASNADLRDYIFTTFPNEPGVDVASQTITGVLGRDDPAFFDVESKINSDEDANIDGWEIALQHNFGESGYGFIANATFADGDAEFDDKSDEPQFALPGLSDTRNFIGYYDKDGLQVRVAYNWRDKYFTGGVTQPSYTDEYEQWDVTASYELVEGLIVFVEGLNVTNETTKTYARSGLQVNEVAQTGERYNFGFRYTF
jgi:TonB-dependent receptor